MFTREQYMRGDVTHAAYYGQFVNRAVQGAVRRGIGIDALARSNDPRFNDIPLRMWDVVSYSIRPLVDRALLRDAGEQWTDAVAVCIAKQAGHEILIQHMAERLEVA